LKLKLKLKFKKISREAAKARRVSLRRWKIGDRIWDMGVGGRIRMRIRIKKKRKAKSENYEEALALDLLLTANG